MLDLVVNPEDWFSGVSVHMIDIFYGERVGLEVECQTPNGEVEFKYHWTWVLSLSKKHYLTLALVNTQEAMALSQLQ